MKYLAEYNHTPPDDHWAFANKRVLEKILDELLHPATMAMCLEERERESVRRQIQICKSAIQAFERGQPVLFAQSDGYYFAIADPTDKECPSCGAVLRISQTECHFCFTKLTVDSGESN